MLMRIRVWHLAGLFAAALVGLPQRMPAATPEAAAATPRPRPGWMRFPARSRIDVRTLGGRTEKPLELWTLGPKKTPISIGRFEGETEGGKNLPVGDYEKETSLLFWHEVAPGEPLSWAADSSQSSVYSVSPDPRGGYRVTIVDPRHTGTPRTPLLTFWVRSSPLPGGPVVASITSGDVTGSAGAPSSLAGTGTAGAVQGHAPVLPVLPPMGAQASSGLITPADSVAKAPSAGAREVPRTIWTRNTHFVLATLSFVVSLLLFHHVLVRRRRHDGFEGRRQELDHLLNMQEPQAVLQRVESWMSVDLPPSTLAFLMGYRSLALFMAGAVEQAVEALDRTELNRLPLDMVTRLTDELRKAPVLPHRDRHDHPAPLVVEAPAEPTPPLESAGIEEFLALSGVLGASPLPVPVPMPLPSVDPEPVPSLDPEPVPGTSEARPGKPETPPAPAAPPPSQENPRTVFLRVIAPFLARLSGAFEAFRSLSPGIHWQGAAKTAVPGAAPERAPDPVTEVSKPADGSVPTKAAPATSPGPAPVLALEGHPFLELARKKGESADGGRWLERLVPPKSPEPRTRQIWNNQMALSSLTRLTRRFPPRLRGMDLRVSDPFVAVFSSREPDEDRHVHVWMLSPVLATVPQIADELLRQARHFSGLTHPELLAIHRAEAKPHPHFVSEAFEGRTLAEVLARIGRFSLRDTLRVTARVAGALDYCHQRGFVHQDLRPGAIFVTETEVRVGCPILATFPVEELRRETGEVHPRAPYLAPEILAGQDPDFASDIYQLGCILLEMITGTRPESGSLPGQAGWEPASARVPGVPDELDQVITRCLHADPMRRYRDVGQVHELLTQLEREHTSPARVGHSLLETLKLTGRGPLKDLARVLAGWSALADPRTLPAPRITEVMDLIAGPGALLSTLVWVVGTCGELEGQGLESLRRLSGAIADFLPYLDGLSRAKPVLASTAPETLRHALADVEQRTTGIVQKIDELLTHCSLRYREILEDLASELPIPVDLENIRPTIASHFAQVAHAQTQLAEVFRLILETSRSSGAERVVVTGETLEDGRSVRIVFREKLAHEGVQIRAPRPWSAHRRGRQLGNMTRQIEELGGTLTTLGDGGQAGVRITLPGRV